MTITDILAEARADLTSRQGRGARYDAASAPTRDLALARLATAYFARKLNELSDSQLEMPSARPGWSRRRVVAAIGLEARKIAQSIAEAAGLVSDEREPTGTEALDLAETLPARALRHLVSHADIHLNVVWRDLNDEQWRRAALVDGQTIALVKTPELRAISLWTASIWLGNGARMTDVPQPLLGRVTATTNTNAQRTSI